jgi:hypothetical protein
LLVLDIPYFNIRPAGHIGEQLSETPIGIATVDHIRNSLGVSSAALTHHVARQDVNRKPQCGHSIRACGTRPLHLKQFQSGGVMSLLKATCELLAKYPPQSLHWTCSGPSVLPVGMKYMWLLSTCFVNNAGFRFRQFGQLM